MNPNAQFERDLEQWLQTEAPASAPAGFHASVMDRARTLRQRPGWATSLPVRRFRRGRGPTLFAVAALLIVGGALAAGSGFLRLPSVVPPVPAPSFGVVATASPEATPPSPSESAAPSASPGSLDCAVVPGDASDPTGSLAWTRESLKKDWPAPVRPETAGGGSVQPMPRTYSDPVGDNGSTAHPCVDIRWAMADTSEVHLKLVSNTLSSSMSAASNAPVVDPTEQWIAYGVVTDEDGDGVPDWRYGIDNMPADAAEEGPPRRGWRTNLHTGQTEAGPEHWEDFWKNGGGFKSGLSTDSADWEPDAEFRFGGAVETTQGSQGWGFELDMPFYAWASVIVNGRVVATDYAPDSGWLVATPGVAITPNKFPGGTWLIEELGIGLGFDDGGTLPLRVSMTVPHGWTVGGPWGEGTANTRLEFGVVGHPWDGCPDTIEPKLGPSFDDLVTYLAKDVPQIDISESTDVTVDGYRGRYLRYSAVDKWFDCFSGSPIGGGLNSEAWILDVDGVRLVIAASSDKAPSESVRSEVRQIVESMKIVGVSPSYSPPASPSPTPVPTPAPTPLPPAAGPVPPNARSWKVTVDNRSSEPATLFVASDDGTLRLVGSATPNVVPAGATVQVTFRFPADGGWIFVNPRPGEGAGGGLVNDDQIGIPGNIRITAECGCWVGPAQ